MSGGSHSTPNVSHIARDGGIRYARRGAPAPTLTGVPAGRSITPARPLSSRYCDQHTMRELSSLPSTQLHTLRVPKPGAASRKCSP